MIFEVKNGSFSYTPEQQLLSDITFSLEQGRILCILGQNGIGKTTLLKCMLGLLKWQSGQTLINGKAFCSMSDMENIGYVPQAHRTTFAFTVAEMVAMGRARHIPLFGVPSKLDRQKVLEALEIVGISHIQDKLCSQISGGQLQLVYIARALANDPHLIIMDEPESHLDFKNQFKILSLIEMLKDEKSISCIINTHYPEHALRISDSTLLLGTEGYLFGESCEVINEENMRDFFKVNTRILPVPGESKKIKAFVVVN